eukprot:gene11978-8552_t
MLPGMTAVSPADGGHLGAHTLRLRQTQSIETMRKLVDAFLDSTEKLSMPEQARRNAVAIGSTATSVDTDRKVVEEAYERVFTLPPPHAAAPWHSWIPRLLVPICFADRFEQFLLTAGDEAKFGVVNELSTHILIDCLFLTITVAPIYDMHLDESHTWLEHVCLVVFYLTFQIQLVSILLNAITIFASLEVPSHKFRVWALKRVPNMILCARFHLVGLYSFYVCALLWPLTTVSDPYVALACVLAELVPWVFLTWAMGTSYSAGYLLHLHPIVRLRLLPRDAAVRRAAEEEAQLYADVLAEPALGDEPRADSSPAWQDVGDASLPLGGVHLPLHHAHHHAHVLRSHSHDPEDARALQAVLAAAALPELWPVLAQHDIVSVSQLAAADNDDFRAMGVSIGRRLRLQEALRHIHHS